MNEPAKCEHPVECLETDEYGNTECAWCKEVERLREYSRSLREQLHKTAVIVEQGEFHFEGKEIGLLEIRGGTVYWSPSSADQVTILKHDLPHCKESQVLDYTTWPLGAISLIGCPIGVCPYCGQKGAVLEEPGIPTETIHILYGCSPEITGPIEQHEEVKP